MKKDGWEIVHQTKRYGEHVIIELLAGDVTVTIEKNPTDITLQETFRVKPTHEVADRIGFAFCALLDELTRAIEQKEDEDAKHIQEPALHTVQDDKLEQHRLDAYYSDPPYLAGEHRKEMFKRINRGSADDVG